MFRAGVSVRGVLLGYAESPWRPHGVWKLLSTAGPGKPVIPDTPHPTRSGARLVWHRAVRRTGMLTSLLRLLAKGPGQIQQRLRCPCCVSGSELPGLSPGPKERLQDGVHGESQAKAWGWGQTPWAGS